MSSLCEQTAGMDNERYWQELISRITNQRVPFSGSLALTHRCNLKCLHCYAREDAEPEMPRSELGTGQWLKIIGDIKNGGCLYLLLTGGEPLLRDDFPEIYSFAKKSGFLVTVFTNGTLVAGRVLDLFQELPPRLVEISLYAASAEIHDRITGVPGSFTRALQAIDELIGRKIRIGLKSVLMTLNEAEFPAIEGLARQYGARFRLDAALFPTLAGGRSPLDLRVSPERAVEREFSDPDRVREWREFYRHYRGLATGEKLYICGAGTRTFHVDPTGHLYPCLMVREHGHSLLSGGFARAWNGEVARARGEEADAGSPCFDCREKIACGYCPGFFAMENGSARVPSEYLCAIGKLRQAAINSESPGG